MGKIFRGACVALAGLGGLAAAGPVFAASASDLYYERSVMVAADARCALFTPEIGGALGAAAAQARGAALRGGVAERELDAIQARAVARAGSVACSSRDIAVASERVRSAFSAWSLVSRMRYPGDTLDWNADRTPSYAQVTWRLRQDVAFGQGRMVFGIAGRGATASLLSVASFTDGAQPYAARLVIRDTATTLGPFIDRRAAGVVPLASRVPPRSGARVFLAEARSPAGADLAGALASAWTFRFPAAAGEALAHLDPREAVAVEFVFQGRAGDVVRTAYVEVGDFAAGRAFLRVAQR